VIREAAQKLAHVILRLWMIAFHRLRAPRVRLNRPSLIVANHASHLDIAAIFASIPVSDVPRVRTAAARDHVFAFPRPLVEIVKFLFNVFPFERKEKSTDSLRRCEALLARGYHVVMFPEGRRSPDGRFLGFTPGFAAVACKSGAPVVPMRLDGTARALPRHACFPIPHPVSVSPRPALEARRVAHGGRREEYARIVAGAERAISARASPEPAFEY
jgi:1-acyl-sn-glycerol-3-phosphate acyltransferase